MFLTATGAVCSAGSKPSSGVCTASLTYTVPDTQDNTVSLSTSSYSRNSAWLRRDRYTAMDHRWTPLIQGSIRRVTSKCSQIRKARDTGDDHCESLSHVSKCQKRQPSDIPCDPCYAVINPNPNTTINSATSLFLAPTYQTRITPSSLKSSSSSHSSPPIPLKSLSLPNHTLALTATKLVPGKNPNTTPN